MLKINGIIVANEFFPNGETIFKDIKIEKEMTFYLKYESDKDFFALVIYAKYVREISKDCIMYLNMPYLPYSRMDRLISNYVFSLKYFADLIKGLNFDRIFSEDIHSEVSHKLFLNLTETSPWSNIQEALSYEPNVDYFFYPDKGAMKRYSEKFNLKNKNHFCGDKKRDVTTGEILGYELIDSPILFGKTVFIIDDLCAKGFTFYNAGMKLKEAGAKRVILYVTHCENSIYDGIMLNSDYIDKIYTTDSILTILQNPKIQII